MTSKASTGSGAAPQARTPRGRGTAGSHAARAEGSANSLGWSRLSRALVRATTQPDYAGRMAMSLSFTAVFEPVEAGWVEARIREFPAVITAAPSLDEARDLLADALAEYLRALAAEDGVLPEGVTLEPLPVHVGR